MSKLGNHDMNDAFNIYVKQLRGGETEHLNESLPPDFLGINEKDLAFKDNVCVEGDAYLADNELILHLNIAANAIVPCAICNEDVDVEIAIEDFYHAVPLSEVKTGIYNLSDILRETILLEVPAIAECQGDCPRRKDVQKYMKTKKSATRGDADDDEGYRPFADLN